MASSVVVLLGAFVAFVNQFQIKPEERILLAKFGSRQWEFGVQLPT